MGFSHVLLSWVLVQRTVRLFVMPPNCSIERLSTVPTVSRAITIPLSLSIAAMEKNNNEEVKGRALISYTECRKTNPNTIP
jgi:hypothetical protein